MIADATTWPGIPAAAWPPAQATTGTASADLTPYIPPRGRGIHSIPDGTPLACWLPIKPGLTVHGLRHGHKTWMAEDGIPEILAEQRLGHEVPGMRGLYAHASDRMRDELKHALQTRWEDSLSARTAINPHSPLPLLDELLAAEVTDRNQATPGSREKTISQFPPKSAARATLAIKGEPELRPSDLARYLKSESGAKGTRTPDPVLANNRHHVHPRPSPQVTIPERVSASSWIRTCCGTFMLYSPPRHGPPKNLRDSAAVPLAGLHPPREESEWILRLQGNPRSPARATYLIFPSWLIWR